MRLDHIIGLFPRAQGVNDGMRTAPAKGTVANVKASVQPLRSQQAYEAFGVDTSDAVKVFLPPETIVPENAGFDFGSVQYIVQGHAERHIYGRSTDHVRLYAVTAE